MLILSVSTLGEMVGHQGAGIDIVRLYPVNNLQGKCPFSDVSLISEPRIMSEERTTWLGLSVLHHSTNSCTR